PSCRVRTDTGAWYCDPCAEGGAFPNLLAGLGITGPEYGLALTRYTVGRVDLDDLPSGGSGSAAEEIDPGWQPLPGERSPSPADARYPYHDEAGEHVATVHRLTQDGKKTYP